MGNHRNREIIDCIRFSSTMPYDVQAKRLTRKYRDPFYDLSSHTIISRWSLHRSESNRVQISRLRKLISKKRWKNVEKLSVKGIHNSSMLQSEKKVIKNANYLISILCVGSSIDCWSLVPSKIKKIDKKKTIL